MYPRGISAFVRTLALIGAFPTRRTPVEKLASLVRRLHPLQSGRGYRRLGGDGDGGYVVPDDLDGIESCWSAGIGRDCHHGLDVPPTMEFTFLRRDQWPAEPSWRSDFPRSLDQPNDTSAPVVLPRCWHR